MDDQTSRAQVHARALPRPHRFGPVRMMLAALAAGVLSVLVLAPALAQENGAPPGVIEAVVADLAARENVDAAEIEVLRTEGVVWSDGCLGAAEPGEACTQALVPGYVVWLGIGNDAYRYHTDDTGAQFRFAEGPLLAADVSGALIPEGVAEDDAVDPVDIVQVLAAFGVTAEVTGEIAAHDWIPVDGGVVVADGATIEVFELESEAAVLTALQGLHFEGGSAIPPDNATIWAVENHLIILLNADQHVALEAAASEALGAPYVSTVDGEPQAAPAEPADSAPAPAPAETGSGGLTAGDTSTAVAALLVVLAAATVLGGRALTAGGRQS